MRLLKMGTGIGAGVMALTMGSEGLRPAQAGQWIVKVYHTQSGDSSTWDSGQPGENKMVPYPLHHWYTGTFYTGWQGQEGANWSSPDYWEATAWRGHTAKASLNNIVWVHLKWEPSGWFDPPATVAGLSLKANSRVVLSRSGSSTHDLSNGLGTKVTTHEGTDHRGRRVTYWSSNGWLHVTIPNPERSATLQYGPLRVFAEGTATSPVRRIPQPDGRESEEDDGAEVSTNSWFSAYPRTRALLISSNHDTCYKKVTSRAALPKLRDYDTGELVTDPETGEPVIDTSKLRLTYGSNDADGPWAVQVEREPSGAFTAVSSADWVDANRQNIQGGTKGWYGFSRYAASQYSYSQPKFTWGDFSPEAPLHRKEENDSVVNAGGLYYLGVDENDPYAQGIWGHVLGGDNAGCAALAEVLSPPQAGGIQ